MKTVLDINDIYDAVEAGAFRASVSDARSEAKAKESERKKQQHERLRALQGGA